MKTRCIKVKYHTVIAAWRGVGNLCFMHVHDEPDLPDDFNVYRCKKCKGFHFGHKKWWKGKAGSKGMASSPTFR